MMYVLCNSAHLFPGCFYLRVLYRLKCSCKCINDFLLPSCPDFYCSDEKQYFEAWQCIDKNRGVLYIFLLKNYSKLPWLLLFTCILKNGLTVSFQLRFNSFFFCSPWCSLFSIQSNQNYIPASKAHNSQMFQVQKRASDLLLLSFDRCNLFLSKWC